MNITSYIGFISEWLGAIAVTWLLSLSPRFQKPPVGFRYPRRDGLVALSLSVLIIIFSFFYHKTVNPPVFPQPLRIGPAPVHTLIQSLVLALICVAPFIIALLVRRQPPRSAGWNPALIVPGLQLGLAMGLLTVFLRNRVMDVLGGLAGPVMTLLPIALIISLAEETIFRGYIQMRLVWWLGAWPGIIISAGIFTIWHLPAWLSYLPNETTLILSGLTFVQGLVLGWLMRKSGTVLAPALYRAFSIWVSLIG